MTIRLTSISLACALLVFLAFGGASSAATSKKSLTAAAELIANEIGTLAKAHAAGRTADIQRSRLLRLEQSVDELLEKTHEAQEESSKPLYIYFAGINHQEREAILNIFKKVLSKNAAARFDSKMVLYDSWSQSLESDILDYGIKFVYLFNDKFRNYANYRRALHNYARNGGSCFEDYGPARAVPETCITTLAMDGFRELGAFQVALEWARERSSLIDRLGNISPEVQVKAAVEQAELELLYGTVREAKLASAKAAMLIDKVSNSEKFRKRLAAIRVNLSSLKQKPAKNVGGSKVTSEEVIEILEQFSSRTNRQYDLVATIVRDLHRGQLRKGLSSTVDKALAVHNKYRKHLSKCRRGKNPKESAREARIFVPFFSESFSRQQPKAFCEFLFERNLKRKRRLAIYVVDTAYEPFGNFGSEVSFFEEFTQIIRALETLGYRLAAQVSRENFYRLFDANFKPDQPTRAEVQIKLALEFIEVGLGSASNFIRRKRYKRASSRLQEITRIAELRLSREWQGGASNIGQIVSQMRPQLIEALRQWQIIAGARHKLNRNSLAENVFRTAQLLKLGDVALAQQAGLRRSTALSEKSAKLIANYETASAQVRHLSSLKSGLAYAIDDGVEAAAHKATLRERELKKQLNRDLPFYESFSSVSPVSIKTVQSRLASDEALVVLLPQTKMTAAFAVNKKTSMFISLGISASQIEIDVAKLRSGLDPQTTNLSDPNSFNSKLAHDLYLRLLAPADRVLKRAKHLFVVSDGALSSLPLHVLVTKKPKRNQRLADIAWLAKSQAITVVPSVANLAAGGASGSREPQENRKALIGFGDPEFQNSRSTSKSNQRNLASLSSIIRGATTDFSEVPDIPALPETRSELNSIAQSTGANGTDLFFGRDASESRIKSISQSGELASYSVVYFATHGVLPGELNGENEAGLVLSFPNSPTKLDDGLLSASEISTLKLNADWVVLSACNTAGAEQSGGEALSGLTKAFFAAGARSVLASHWLVVSEAAVTLTTAAFAKLNVSPKLARAKALQSAMLDVLARAGETHRSHPAYWGPFVVVGNSSN